MEIVRSLDLNFIKDDIWSLIDFPGNKTTIRTMYHYQDTTVYLIKKNHKLQAELLDIR